MKKIRVLSILLIALMIMAMMPGQMIAFADEETFTVTFNSNGGNSVEPQTVAKGEKAVEPKEMQNGDLNLLGWFVNPTIDNLVNMETFMPNKFDFDAPITEDVELTAVWVATLTVNIEGSGRIDVVNEGEKPELEGEYPFQSNMTNAVVGIWDTFVIGAKADEGYVFKEWKDADSGETFSKDSITTVKVTGVKNLLAVFEEEGSETHTVTFNSNGGTDVESQEVAHGEKAVKPEDPKNNSGLDFLGWFLNPTIDNLFDVETMTLNLFNFDTPIVNDVELTGVWRAMMTVNTEGLGRIDVVEEGQQPELDDDHPYQSNITNAFLGIWDSFVIGAKADEGYVFKEWRNEDTGNTFSKDSIVNVKLRFPLNLIAVFEPEAKEDDKEVMPTDTEKETVKPTKPDATKTDTNITDKSDSKTNNTSGSKDATNSGSKTATKVPKTGDENNMLTWVAIAGLAAAIIIVIIYQRKHDHTK